MKSIYLQLSVLLAAATQVWVQAAAQGVEQALVSVTVEYCSEVLRARASVFPNINFLWPVRISTRADKHKF